MGIENKVQLITYPDSLGGNLKTLDTVLSEQFSGIFKGGIHILPPFPSSGDRGFAPTTYFRINPEFGTWSDIKRISNKYNVMLDLMMNHISGESHYFQDFLKHGFDSKFADLFIMVKDLWHNGKIPGKDFDKIFLRRKKPYSTYRIGKCSKEIKLWTTFGKKDPSDQIDLNINSKATWKYFRDILKYFCYNNIRFIRLDAAAYVIKKPGTSCFFVQPEIMDVLDKISDIADSLGITLLPEIHSSYEYQFKLAEQGYLIYDFILPFMVLYTFQNRNSKKIRNYLKKRPHNQFTMLDCHDGIPVKPDLDGIITSEEAGKIVDNCLKLGSNLSRIYSPAHKNKDGFDIHQIRCTFYSVLNCNDDTYLAARAIQFFTPGIPQVYYVGLLAGENDLENSALNYDGREINRHNYSIDEINTALGKKAVQRLLTLIQFRNEYSAFNGDFSVKDSNSNMLIMKWNKENKFCELKVNLNSCKSEITYISKDGKELKYNI